MALSEGPSSADVEEDLPELDGPQHEIYFLNIFSPQIWEVMFVNGVVHDERVVSTDTLIRCIRFYEKPDDRLIQTMFCIAKSGILSFNGPSIRCDMQILLPHEGEISLFQSEWIMLFPMSDLQNTELTFKSTPEVDDEGNSRQYMFTWNGQGVYIVPRTEDWFCTMMVNGYTRGHIMVMYFGLSSNGMTINLS